MIMCFKEMPADIGAILPYTAAKDADIARKDLDLTTVHADIARDAADIERDLGAVWNFRNAENRASDLNCESCAYLPRKI